MAAQWRSYSLISKFPWIFLAINFSKEKESSSLLLILRSYYYSKLFQSTRLLLSNLKSKRKAYEELPCRYSPYLRKKTLLLCENSYLNKKHSTPSISTFSASDKNFNLSISIVDFMTSYSFYISLSSSSFYSLLYIFDKFCKKFLPNSKKTSKSRSSTIQNEKPRIWKFELIQNPNESIVK